MRTPTWRQIERFLKIDGGWHATRHTKHVFYEKHLPDGRTLNTHVSHARDKGMSLRTFKLICETQLAVTVDEFWETLDRNRGVRSSTAPTASRERRPTLAMMMELRRKLRLTEAQLEGITFDEARRRLDEHHSRPAGSDFG